MTARESVTALDVQLEAHGTTETRADVRLAECDERDDLERALNAWRDEGHGTLVVDLRTERRPAVSLREATDVAVTVARARGARVLRFLVTTDAVARMLLTGLRSTEGRASRFTRANVHVALRVGDLVRTAADALVNASNTRLELGSGVSGALARACGPGLQREMSALAPLAEGALAVTHAHALPTVRFILHIATASGREEDITRGIDAVLRYASARELARVAFPAVGTGVGGLSVERCAAIFADRVAAHADQHADGLVVIIVLWSDDHFSVFDALFDSDARWTRA